MQKAHHTFIIAEIGVNHNGDTNIGKKLISEAKKSGADAVKFQSFKAEDLVTKTAEKALYQLENTGKSCTQYQMLKHLELSHEDHFTLIDHCNKENIKFLSSAFGVNDARFLKHECKLDTIKLGSGELTNAPLLLDIARLNCNVIISTGMSDEEEIENALGVLAFGYFEDQNTPPSINVFRQSYTKHKNKLKKYVSILQCTTDYPCANEHVNLNAIQSLKSRFNCPVGFSDHTSDIYITAAAIALGASIIEKHFTLSNSMEGPDHLASLEPDDFSKMVSIIRNTELALGDGALRRMPPEEKIKYNARKSIVAKVKIAKGTKITSEMLTTKRPECGLSPYYFWDIVGTNATRNYNIDEPITK